MMQLAENIPGKPHRWAEAICAWARGELAQWRYVSPEATDADWRDCDYPSRGRPNFEHPDLEYRAAPTHRKPSEPAQDERAAFEAWWKTEADFDGQFVRSGSVYHAQETTDAWLGWNARAAIAQIDAISNPRQDEL